MVDWGQRFTHSFLALEFLSGYVHRSTLPQSRFRSTAPSEREPGFGAYHSTHRPEAATLRAIFIAPTEGNAPPGSCNAAGDFHRPYGGRGPFIVPPGNCNAAGDFHRPYGGRAFQRALGGNKNFQPSTFPLFLRLSPPPEGGGNMERERKRLICSRGRQPPEPCRPRCRCTSRSSW